MGSILLFISALAHLLLPHPGLEECIIFFLPSASLALLVLLRERHCVTHSDGERFVCLLRACAPFGLGVLVPTSAFLLLYLKEHALHALLRGVFILPFIRTWGVYESLPSIPTIKPCLCLLGVLLLGILIRGKARTGLVAGVGVITTFYVISSEYNAVSYQTVWHMAYWLASLIGLVGVSAIYVRPTGRRASAEFLRRQQLFLILAVAGMSSLVQYPFSAPIYFCYIAPLAILVVMAVLCEFPSISSPLLIILYFGFLLFVVLRVTPTFIYRMGQYAQGDQETYPLDLPRASHLRVDDGAATGYVRLVGLIKEHARGEEIYAAPDCPEIYFLTGSKNPTPDLFELFDANYPDSEGILKLLDTHSIHLIVLHKYPSFSELLPSKLHKQLVNRFPEAANLLDFEVRWRN